MQGVIGMNNIQFILLYLLMARLKWTSTYRQSILNRFSSQPLAEPVVLAYRQVNSTIPHTSYHHTYIRSPFTQEEYCEPIHIHKLKTTLHSMYKVHSAKDQWVVIENISLLCYLQLFISYGVHIHINYNF